MRRECCVCHKFLGVKEGPKDTVSHGFCDACLKTYKDKMMAEFEEFDKSKMIIREIKSESNRQTY